MVRKGKNQIEKYPVLAPCFESDRQMGERDQSSRKCNLCRKMKGTGWKRKEYDLKYINICQVVAVKILTRYSQYLSK